MPCSLFGCTHPHVECCMAHQIFSLSCRQSLRWKTSLNFSRYVPHEGWLPKFVASIHACQLCMMCIQKGQHYECIKQPQICMYFLELFYILPIFVKCTDGCISMICKDPVNSWVCVESSICFYFLFKKKFRIQCHYLYVTGVKLHEYGVAN